MFQAKQLYFQMTNAFEPNFLTLPKTWQFVPWVDPLNEISLLKFTQYFLLTQWFRFEVALTQFLYLLWVPLSPNEALAWSSLLWSQSKFQRFPSQFAFLPWFEQDFDSKFQSLV